MSYLLLRSMLLLKVFTRIFKPLWDVDFLTCDNSICGSRDDIEKHVSLDYGSFSLPLSAKKVDD